MTRGRLFTIASALSLLLFLATVVLWVRSYCITELIAGDRINAKQEHLGYCLIASWKGRLIFQWEQLSEPLSRSIWSLYIPPGYESRPGVADEPPVSGPIPPSAYGGVWGFGWLDRSFHTLPPNSGHAFFSKNVTRQIFIIVPYYALVIPELILPLLWLRLNLRPKTADRCYRCDYNLTGNTSGACPECGTAVPQKSEVLT